MVIGRMNRAGAETMIMNIYRNIDRNNVQFDFAVHTKERADYDDEIISLGGRIFRFPEYKVYNAISYKKAWNDFFKEHNGEFCAVHGHLGSSAALYLSVAKKFNVFTIAHSHNCVTGLTGILYRILCYPQRFIADAFFGCSQAAGIDRFGKYVAENPKLYKNINNGIAAEKYIYNPKIRNDYRNKFRVENKFVIGHIGRLTKVKNHKFLLEIFSEIKKQRNNAVLMLVGRGELETEIRHYAEKLNITKDVVFCSVRDDVSNLLQSFDVFVFPSIYEGLPVTILEAQASGLPCVVSYAVPDAAIITPQNFKKLSLKKSAAEWANYVIELYEAVERTNTYESVVNRNFDVVATAKQLENFYISINN